jgi:hypothetical protein
VPTLSLIANNFVEFVPGIREIHIETSEEDVPRIFDSARLAPGAFSLQVPLHTLQTPFPGPSGWPLTWTVVENDGFGISTVNAVNLTCLTINLAVAMALGALSFAVAWTATIRCPQRRILHGTRGIFIAYSAVGLFLLSLRSSLFVSGIDLDAIVPMSLVFLALIPIGAVLHAVIVRSGRTERIA